MAGQNNHAEQHLEGAKTAQIFKHINLAIAENPDSPTNIHFIPEAETLLISKSKLAETIRSKLDRSVPPSALRRLGLKLAVKYNILPSKFYLVGVKTLQNEAVSQGSFADVYKGQYGDQYVALKLLRNRVRDGQLKSDKEKQQGNIMVDEASNVLLTDFGISLLSQANHGNYGFSSDGGAWQYRAPELIDPEECGFDPDKTQPTAESDVYAFACVCIEIYTDRTPYSDNANFVSTYGFAKKVVYGKRPDRPSTPDGKQMPDTMWQLVNRCWDRETSKRPSSSSLSDSMAAIVAGKEPEFLRSVPAPVSTAQVEELQKGPIASGRPRTASEDRSCCIIA
ncbi:hypothetical protein EUX98_g5004 [Antrodiella citrinella]|uniref:Protein kinase domain-containing protein n=1 Tax=Antrodiella citrinella TaxID=2447956 RepID=A0A4S4N0I0_9APHY|nr:hypothetical protein EUX98_g5004 [Antrodiella citrinella]